MDKTVVGVVAGGVSFLLGIALAMFCGQSLTEVTAQLDDVTAQRDATAAEVADLKTQLDATKGNLRKSRAAHQKLLSARAAKAKVATAAARKQLSEEQLKQIRANESELSEWKQWLSDWAEVVDQKFTLSVLKEKGWVLKFDPEAKLCVVDQDCWDRLSVLEGGRTVLVGSIGVAMGKHNKKEYDLPDNEVTVYSSETGRSLGWVDGDYDVHIFR